MREIANRLSSLKVLVVYASFGEGHLQAAQALKQSFARMGAEHVLLVDLLAESHPKLNELSRFFYNRSYSLWPQVYGWMYEATKGMKPDSLFAQWLHSFGAGTLKRIVDRERPDAVIHTFPMLVLPYIARRGRRRIPMYNVVTDFDLHMRWVHPNVEKYYVATDDLRAALANTGVPLARIAATGIPLRAGFANAASPAAGAGAPAAALTPTAAAAPALAPPTPAAGAPAAAMPRRSSELAAVAERFGLDPARPIALVMGGAVNSPAALRRLCDSLLAADGAVPGGGAPAAGRLQLAVVCGRNHPLETAMRRQYDAEMPHPIPTAPALSEAARTASAPSGNAAAAPALSGPVRPASDPSGNAAAAPASSSAAQAVSASSGAAAHQPAPFSAALAASAPSGAARADVRVFGYVERIDELMRLADCIVTKPGGLTLSEAITAGLPIFLLRPTPGQERNNASYLAAKGAAVVCRTPGELAASVADLLRRPERREAMQTAVAALRKDGAADRIALDIVLDLSII